MTYGILASQSCLLTDIADYLHEPVKKVNVVERLGRHLEKGIPRPSATAYLQQVRKMVPSEPVIHIDDSDMTKPVGYKFEALGIVRDGSQSTATKKCLQKRLSCYRGLRPYHQQSSCQHFFQAPFVFGKGIQIRQYDHVLCYGTSSGLIW